MAVYKYWTDRRSDGQIYGYASSDPISFYGAAPVTRQTAPTACATTVALSTTTGAITSWGFATSTQANAVTKAVSDIVTVLTNLGLVG